MSNKIKTKYGKALLSAIEKLEARIGADLPIEYRTFLLENNGGTPERENFEIEGKAYAVCYFYHLGQTPQDFNDLLDKAEDIGDLVPEELLPIARDYFGNMICLGFKGKERGQLYFWDHDFGADDLETPDYSNCKLIEAKNFTDFLENLK